MSSQKTREWGIVADVRGVEEEVAPIAGLTSVISIKMVFLRAACEEVGLAGEVTEWSVCHDMRPSDQLLTKININGAEGEVVRHDISATVPVLEPSNAN